MENKGGIMGQILHLCAVTTPATRRKIQNSQKSIAELAEQYGTALNTVFKWKKREELDGGFIKIVLEILWRQKSKQNLLHLLFRTGPQN